MQEDRRRVWPRMLAWFIVLTVIFLGAYYALTGYLAYRDLQSARSELMSARDIATVSPGHAQLSVANATASAQAATERLDGPLWSLLIAIPVVGDSPEAARELTGAFADAMTGLEPLVDDMDLLLASALVAPGGLQADPIDVAAPDARAALPKIEAAQRRLDAIPEDGAVLPQIRDATTELQDQLELVHAALASVASDA